jgi:hypothetical protein
VNIYGTGSKPPLKRGLHFNILFMDRYKPFIKPYFLNELIEYSEQVGLNRQLGPIRGDI